MKENCLKKACIGIFLLLLTLFSCKVNAQNNPSRIPRDTLIRAAREIISANHFCALVTMDSTGQPQVRTMNPFPLGEEIVVWFATSRNSRKVGEIKKNPKVCVYYADHNNATGYVNIVGTAVIIDDKELLVKMKRDYWAGIPNWQDKFVLVKVTPKSLDVINYARGISGDPVTNRSPTITF